MALNDNFTITIGNPDDFNEPPLFEGPVDTTAMPIIDGNYFAQRWDTDAPITVTVENGRVTKWVPFTR